MLNSSCIDSIIADAMERRFELNLRKIELAVLLNNIFQPLIENKDATFEFGGHKYSFDELLILLFEFSQIVLILDSCKSGVKEMENLLVLHRVRLVDLIVRGRLNHLMPLLNFREVIDSNLFK